MKKHHKPIFVTGVPSSGKTSICEAFSKFGDKCNVIDTDLYGRMTFDRDAGKDIWLVSVKDIKIAIATLYDKPTIITGTSDNISDLLTMYEYLTIYLIDHDSEQIATRLNDKYDIANAVDKVLWETQYGVQKLNASSVDKKFAKIKKEVLQHEKDLDIVQMPIIGIVADIALHLFNISDDK